MPKPPVKRVNHKPIHGVDTLVKGLNRLFSRLRPAPVLWIDKTDVLKPNANNLEPLACTEWSVLIDAWKQAMVWTPGLDSALAVMLASSLSTMLVGDQLWVKIIGPASSGKSTLCEALSINTQYILAKSTIRGFHSGFGEGEHNLIDQASGKTLIIKDGDTLIQSPGLAQILSEGRDLYDTITRSSYRNKASKDHVGVRMTWILAGTSSLRQIDSSELGERFLDCVIMEGINSDLEEIICLSAAKGAAFSSQLEITNDAETRYSPEMSLAMRLTGGYVTHLRKNCADITSRVSFSEEDLLRFSQYAVFTSHMRARPSKTQKETDERELAARLTKQITRLGMCLAGVTNKTSLDAEIFDRTRKVVLDTSRGDTMAIIQKLVASKTGMEVVGLSQSVGQLEDKTRELVRFLRKLDVLELVPTYRRYRVTDKFRNLYLKVIK